MMKLFIAAFVVGLSATSANATITDYMVNGALANDVAFSGSFTIDDTKDFTGSFSNVSITVGGTVLDSAAGTMFSGVGDGTSLTRIDFTTSFEGYLSLLVISSHTGTTINAIANQSLQPGGTYSYGFSEVAVQSGNITSSAAAVPEPATWAMFISGFGMIGGAMRRRQRATVRFA